MSYREHYGEAMMGVEFGKKENRSEPGFSTTMAEFLDVSVTLREPSYTCHVWWLQVHGLGGTHGLGCTPCMGWGAQLLVTGCTFVPLACISGQLMICC